MGDTISESAEGEHSLYGTGTDKVEFEAGVSAT